MLQKAIEWSIRRFKERYKDSVIYTFKHLSAWFILGIISIIIAGSCLTFIMLAGMSTGVQTNNVGALTAGQFWGLLVAVGAIFGIIALISMSIGTTDQVGAFISHITCPSLPTASSVPDILNQYKKNRSKLITLSVVMIIPSIVLVYAPYLLLVDRIQIPKQVVDLGSTGNLTVTPNTILVGVFALVSILISGVYWVSFYNILYENRSIASGIRETLRNMGSQITLYLFVCFISLVTSYLPMGNLLSTTVTLPFSLLIYYCAFMNSKSVASGPLGAHNYTDLPPQISVNS